MPEPQQWAVLDSFAVLAVVEKEPAEVEVVRWLRRAEAGEVSLAMSVVNVGEILYTVARRYGDQGAEKVLALLQSLPIAFFEATLPRALTAAYYKAHYPIAYADAFAAALAAELNAVLLTGDPEFQALEGHIVIHWLPRKGAA